MFSKKFNPVVAILALVTTLFVALPAQPASAAVNAASLDSSPTDGATVSVDDVINVKNNLTLPDNATVDATMSQTWGAARAAFVAAVVPSGWSLDYQVGGSAWGALPTDLKTVSGVRASITGLTTGASHTTNGATALVRKPSQLVVADSATVAASGRGDGWDVFFTPKYILNVYHHDANYKLECHTRATGELCNSTLYTVNGIPTSQGSGGTYYGGKIYSYVGNGSTSAVICTEVTTTTFNPCGVTSMTTGSMSNPQTGQSTQTFDGTRIWAVDVPNSKLMCFNVKTAVSCGNTAIASFAAGSGSIPAFVTYLDGQIYIAANKLYCYKTDATVCAGTWPVTYGNSKKAYVNPIPYFDVASATAGAIKGVCSFAWSSYGNTECSTTMGASLAVPAGLSSLMGAASTRISGGSGYWETKAYMGTKIYWSTNPTGTDWAAGRAMCYDYATDAQCAGFATTYDIGQQRYALSTDPTNPGCIWTNGNDGAISNFDGTTGKIGCPVTTVKGIVNFDAIPSSACSLVSPLATSFGSVIFTAPAGVTVTNLRVSIRDGSGNDVVGWTDLTPAADGSIDLSTLTSAQTSSSFSFIITGAGLTKAQAASIDTQLIYTVDMLQPYQLCVVVKVLPTCTFATGATTAAQDDIVFSGATSKTISGTTTVETASRTFHVNPATVAQCTAPNYGDDSGRGGEVIDTTPVKRGPIITHIDKREWATNTGGRVVITGDNWIAVQKLVIDGKSVNIVKSTDGEMTIDLPPSPTGVYSFVLYTDNGVLTFDSAFKFTPNAIPDPAAGARPPVTITIGNFIDGSPVITKAIAAKIKAFMAKYSDYRTIECIGYTEGPTVLKTDKALSLKRATNACGYVRKTLKKVMVQLPLKNGQDTIEQSQRRRITITLRD